MGVERPSRGKARGGKLVARLGKQREWKSANATGRGKKKFDDLQVAKREWSVG